MFGPSLLSMLAHTLWSSPNAFSSYAPGDGALVRDLWAALRGSRRDELRLPVVARSKTPRRLLGELRDAPLETMAVGGAASLAWGWIPVANLVRYHELTHTVPASEEVLDLLTPLRPMAAPASASRASVSSLLAKTAPPGRQALTVAIVDRGERVPGGKADDFGGQLDVLNPHGLELEAHALAVLEALLARLNSHGLLPSVRVACALVPEPSQPIALECFEHPNAKELLDAIQAVARHAGQSQGPLLVNISLGTHCGPHNGQSPLEDAVVALATAPPATPPGAWFVHAAAGNDGLRNNHAIRHVAPGSPQALRLYPGHGKQLLVELWWDETLGGPLEVTVRVADPQGHPVLAQTRIDGKTAARFQAPQGMWPYCRQSLCHQRAYNDMSCIAFALTVDPTATQATLGGLTVDFTLVAPRDTDVNGWIVVEPEGQTAMAAPSHFAGASGGGVCVPSTSPGAVCVSAVDVHGHPLPVASSGPPCDYGQKRIERPQLAHLGDAPASTAFGAGTSFAAPRACADAARVLLSGKPCLTIKDLLRELASVAARTPAQWDPQIGFAALV